MERYDSYRRTALSATRYQPAPTQCSDENTSLPYAGTHNAGPDGHANAANSGTNISSRNCHEHASPANLYADVHCRECHKYPDPAVADSIFAYQHANHGYPGTGPGNAYRG